MDNTMNALDITLTYFGEANNSTKLNSSQFTCFRTISIKGQDCNILVYQQDELLHVDIQGEACIHLLKNT